jgi:outer membrane protein OmpA-like peptidoglycan-associated protein
MLAAAMSSPASSTERASIRRDPAAGTTLDEPREPAAAESPLPDHPMLALQREAGNAAVSRMLGARALARQPVGAPAPPAADLAAYMSHPYAAKNVHPTTGRGLFDADYDPATGAMTITVRVCFNFRTGNIMDPDWLAAMGGWPGLMNAWAANGWTASDFIWTEDEKKAWAASAISEVLDLWSEQYVFFSQKPGWESLPPVHVNVVITEGAEDKSQWVIDVNKWPDAGPLEESMDVPGGTDTQSHGRLQEESRDAGGVTSPDRSTFTRDTSTRARYGQVDTDNPGIVFFDQGSSAVSATDAADLQKFGATLGAPDMPPFPVVLTGHASAEGKEDFNKRLSEDRARTVSNEIVKGGAKLTPTSTGKGEEGATEDPGWRMVEIDVKEFTSKQTTVKHEFGHILGLGDEYPTKDTTPPAPPSSRPVGTPVAHSALAQRLIPGQQPILAHHDESIMSNGEEVRPYHYVTFLEALGNMTGTTGTWGIRPGPGPGAHGPGDFPAPPGPDDPQAA